MSSRHRPEAGSDERRGAVDPTPEPRELPPAAQRALAEAAERRRAVEAADAAPREINGRGGAEPVRFGDWEVKGLAVDF